MTKLLSPKALEEYSPEAFKERIRGLFYKPIKGKGKAKKAPPKEVSWRLNAKGTLVIVIRRKPKWIAPREIDQIALESGKPQNEVWLKVKAKKSGILVQDTALTMRKQR